jgi:hypothetical protein
MFSKEYFNYLMRSKKYLLLFIGLITILNLLGNKEPSLSMIISSMIAIVTAYGMPLIVFYFVHDRKAADTFFSIPVSRNAVLYSSLLFCIVCTAVPYLISAVIFGLSKSFDVLLILSYVVIGLLIICALVIFNTMIYLLANNAIDGVIMLGAYTVLPLSVFICINSFLLSFVCGVVDIPLEFLGYCSPLYMFVSAALKYGDKQSDLISAIFSLLISVAGLFVLKKQFVERQVERASTTSDGFFTYPFIIAVYVMLSLISFASFFSYDYSSLFRYLSDYFFVYLLLFAVFVAAHFIYRRKLYFDYRLPAYFITAMAVSLIFAFAARGSRGFGISESYVKNDRYAFYTLNEWCESDSETYQYLSRQIGSDETYISIYVDAGNENRTAELNEETAIVFEKLRQEAINSYYSDYESYKTRDSSNLNITANDGRRRSSYFYQTRPITLEELTTLAKDKNCYVVINCELGDYVMDPNGQLKATNIYAN